MYIEEVVTTYKSINGTTYYTRSAAVLASKQVFHWEVLVPLRTKVGAFLQRECAYFRDPVFRPHMPLDKIAHMIVFDDFRDRLNDFVLKERITLENNFKKKYPKYFK